MNTPSDINSCTYFTAIRFSGPVCHYKWACTSTQSQLLHPDCFPLAVSVRSKDRFTSREGKIWCKSQLKLQLFFSCFAPFRKHCVESMYFGAQGNIERGRKQGSGGWCEWKKNFLQGYTSVRETGNGYIKNGLSTIMCSLHTPMSCAPPNYQETSITTNRRARFNLHLIATEARCSAVSRDHGDSGFSQASVCSPQLTCALKCPAVFKNGTASSSNENTFLKQTNVKKDFASCAALCTLDGKQGNFGGFLLLQSWARLVFSAEPFSRQQNKYFFVLWPSPCFPQTPYSFVFHVFLSDLFNRLRCYGAVIFKMKIQLG